MLTPLYMQMSNPISSSGPIRKSFSTQINHHGSSIINNLNMSPFTNRKQTKILETKNMDKEEQYLKGYLNETLKDYKDGVLDKEEEENFNKVMKILTKNTIEKIFVMIQKKG